MKILIRLPNWLGDVVMSTAFVYCVRKAYPGSEVDVIIKKDLEKIAKLIDGVNTVYPFSKKEYNGITGAYRFGKKLRKEKYDIFFNLPTSISSVAMARATRSKKRVGFQDEGGYLLLTNAFKKPINIHRVDEYISLIEQFSGKIIKERQLKLKIDNPPDINKNRVLVNFNSEASSRRMPTEKGREIVNLLIKTFPACLFTFIGAPKEALFIDEIIGGIDKIENIENFAGKTDLSGLSSLMAGSAALITTDSGPAHLANAVGIPVIVLFGAGNEHNTAPYIKKNSTVIRYGKLNCEPCTKNTCQLYGIPKCLQLLNELQIIKYLRLYLPNA